MGFRNNEGELVSTETYDTLQLPKHGRGAWDFNVCLAFGDQVLTWVGLVAEPCGSCVKSWCCYVLIFLFVLFCFLCFCCVLRASPLPLPFFLILSVLPPCYPCQVHEYTVDGQFYDLQYDPSVKSVVLSETTREMSSFGDDVVERTTVTTGAGTTRTA